MNIKSNNENKKSTPLKYEKALQYLKNITNIPNTTNNTNRNKNSLFSWQLHLSGKTQCHSWEKHTLTNVHREKKS
mgnify:CR=1 FL=1